MLALGFPLPLELISLAHASWLEGMLPRIPLPLSDTSPLSYASWLKGTLALGFPLPLGLHMRSRVTPRTPIRHESPRSLAHFFLVGRNVGPRVALAPRAPDEVPNPGVGLVERHVGVGAEEARRHLELKEAQADQRTPHVHVLVDPWFVHDGIELSTEVHEEVVLHHVEHPSHHHLILGVAKLHELGVPEESMEGLGGLGGRWGGRGRGGADVRHLVEGLRETSEPVLRGGQCLPFRRLQNLIDAIPTNPRAATPTADQRRAAFLTNQEAPPTYFQYFVHFRKSIYSISY